MPLENFSLFCGLRVLIDMDAEDTKKPTPQPPQYAEEVLCANWNPLALMPAEPLAQAQKSVLEGIDVESFLARLYLSQRA